MKKEYAKYSKKDKVQFKKRKAVIIDCHWCDYMDEFTYLISLKYGGITNCLERDLKEII